VHSVQDSSSFILLREHSKVFKIIYTNFPGNVCPGKWLSGKRPLPLPFTLSCFGTFKPRPKPARELIPHVSKFCLDEWQDCCEVINFTPLLALSSITKICPATILYYSTDFEMVILVSLTHTYYMGMIPQPVSLVEFHSETYISGTVPTCGTFVKNTSRCLLSQTYLKALTIIL